MHLLGEIRSVGELSAAVAGASSNSKLTVIKFFAPWCSSCKSIEPRFDRTARAQAENADFYKVDFSASKAFCKTCEIKFMPVAHIYADGKLTAAMPLGTKAFPKFAKRLEEVVDEMRDAGAGASAGAEADVAASPGDAENATDR